MKISVHELALLRGSHGELHRLRRVNQGILRCVRKTYVAPGNGGDVTILKLLGAPCLGELRAFSWENAFNFWDDGVRIEDGKKVKRHGFAGCCCRCSLRMTYTHRKQKNNQCTPFHS